MKKPDRIQRQQEMLSLIEKWQESGKTQQAFCQEHVSLRPDAYCFPDLGKIILGPKLAI
jgi:hypothetical protein